MSCSDSSVIAYRTFRNTDPPQILRLWNSCGFGRGAAGLRSCDVLDDVAFAPTYFDPSGLLVAEENGRVVGYVHAGFAPDATSSRLDHRQGIINALIVAPDYRGRGVGRELLARGEEYLRSRGATTIIAGPAGAPFYHGIYGGAEFAGFLESDPLIHGFLESQRYRKAETWLVMQRNLARTRDPISAKILSLRRSTVLTTNEADPLPNWWWSTRLGRLETRRESLLQKATGATIADLAIVLLDFYYNCWGGRAAGILDLKVEHSFRRQGYGRQLLVETCKRLREEGVDLVEGRVLDVDAPCVKVFESAGFHVVDRGYTYIRM